MPQSERPIIDCTCEGPGDGTTTCPREDECFVAWLEGRCRRNGVIGRVKS